MTEVVKYTLLNFGLIIFLGLPIAFLIHSIIGTIFHELWHIVVAKILKAEIEGIVLFDFKNFLKSFKLSEEKINKEKISLGRMYIYLPSEKERYRWIVNLAGGLGAGLTLVTGGLLILSWLFINHFLSFGLGSSVYWIGAVVGVTMIIASYIQITGGIKECQKKDFYNWSLEPEKNKK